MEYRVFLKMLANFSIWRNSIMFLNKFLKKNTGSKVF